MTYILHDKEMILRLIFFFTHHQFDIQTHEIYGGQVSNNVSDLVKKEVSNPTWVPLSTIHQAFFTNEGLRYTIWNSRLFAK